MYKRIIAIILKYYVFCRINSVGDRVGGVKNGFYKITWHGSYVNIFSAYEAYFIYYKLFLGKYSSIIWNIGIT